MTTDAGLFRIGELSRRSGVSPETLRAWERRYGLLRPARTEGGFRLYTLADLERVQTVRRLLEEGLSARQAAQQALRGTAVARAPLDRREAAPLLAERRSELADRLRAYDEVGAQAVLDRLLGEVDIDTVMRDVMLPQLQSIGHEWEAGNLSVADEHFATQILRGRLMGLARGWAGGGPHAVLACAPDEEHDVALIMFGIALHRRGWRITFLGARTPVDSLRDAAHANSADLVVVAATEPDRLESVAADLRRLARHVQIAIAGAGATPAIARTIRATLLDGDPVTAAGRIAVAA
jgi:DNA-binding transcriptional MerR regulator